MAVRVRHSAPHFIRFIMKLFLIPSLILASTMILSGCQQDTQQNNEQYQTFIYQNRATNSYLYTSDRGYQDIVQVARIVPQSKYYTLIQKQIEYSIQTNTPVCLRYQSALATKITGVCNNQNVSSIMKNTEVLK